VPRGAALGCLSLLDRPLHGPSSRLEASKPSGRTRCQKTDLLVVSP
jgi:hypothetical protein